MRKRSRTKKKESKTLNIVLVLVAILLISFIVSMIVTFWRFQSIPDVLVTCVLGTGTAELILSALITISKKKYTNSSEDDDE